MNKSLRTSCFKPMFIFCIVLVTGCTSYSLNENGKFGIATNQALNQQKFKNEISSTNASSILTDGQSVKSSVDKYQRSFESSTNLYGTQSQNMSNILGIGTR